MFLNILNIYSLSEVSKAYFQILQLLLTYWKGLKDKYLMFTASFIKWKHLSEGHSAFHLLILRTLTQRKLQFVFCLECVLQVARESSHTPKLTHPTSV